MSVFLRQQKTKQGIKLSFVESFYDSSIQNVKQKVIKSIGLLSELEKTYKDPIEHFKEEAKRLSSESSKKYKDSKIAPIPKGERIKNIGCFIVQNVYDQFNFDNVFEFVKYKRRFQFNISEIFRFFVYSQIVFPSSKRVEFSYKDRFLNNFSFSDDQMYDAAKVIGENEEVIKEYIQQQLKNIVKLNTSQTYFDGTNIYFEIDKETDEIKRGPEKNNRHDPILGLGLLMDGNGLPINYTIFPGNASEQPELHKNVQDLKKKGGIVGKTIIVADKGLNSGDNMYKAIKNGDGYVVGQKVRGSSKDNIAWVLQDDENDKYDVISDENGVVIFKIKEEVGDYPIQITSELNGQKVTVNMRQKRISFWSKDYADKAEYERNKIIERARHITSHPSEYLKSTVGDAASYIKQLVFDKNGEIIAAQSTLTIDDEAIKNAKKLDGFYEIVSSETQLPAKEIIEIYRGLWEIEETFSIVKGVLKVRPVFARTKESIHAHILICFTSLLILRLLQKKFLRKELTNEQVNAIEKANKKKRKHKIQYKKIVEYPIKQICSFIREFNAFKCDDNYYPLNSHALLSFIEEKYGVNLNRKIYTEEDVKKIFSAKIQHKTKTLN